MASDQPANSESSIAMGWIANVQLAVDQARRGRVHHLADGAVGEIQALVRAAPTHRTVRALATRALEEAFATWNSGQNEELLKAMCSLKYRLEQPNS